MLVIGDRFDGNFVKPPLKCASGLLVQEASFLYIAIYLLIILIAAFA
jgi:hypothetical protein